VGVDGQHDAVDLRLTEYFSSRACFLIGLPEALVQLLLV